MERSQSDSNSDEASGEEEEQDVPAVAAPDDLGPTMDEDALDYLLKETKRADTREVTLRVNNALVKIFKKRLVGEGLWDKETREEMRDKYYLSPEQYESLEPPSLKGTRLDMQGL